MAAKKVFMLRVNPEIYEALEVWAADEFRSVNGQLEWIIERSLRESGRKPGKKESPGMNIPEIETP
jgi:hypothetical protein